MMRKFVFAALSIFAALALGGCGGGNNVAPTFTTNTALHDSETVSAGATAFGAAAQQTPKQGSVLQSNINNKPNLGLSSDRNGATTFRNVAEQASMTFNSGDALATERHDGVVSRAYLTINGEKITTERDLLANGINELSDINNIFATEICTWAYGANTDDYLTFGIWAYADIGGDEEVGLFATGGDPFDKTKIDALTGTARYDGSAVGYYQDESGWATFDGTTQLNANFDANTIDGRIYDLEVPPDSGREVLGNPVINLRSATIDPTKDGGFWTGNTDVTGTGDGSTYAGKWGGQFYGENSGQPRFAVGTFGGTETTTGAEGDSSFVGAFGAERQ